MHKWPASTVTVRNKIVEFIRLPLIINKFINVLLLSNGNVIRYTSCGS
jgi:hypothetical protein